MAVLDADHTDPHSLPFEATLATLASLLPENLRRPQVGIVCGSGLSTLAAALREVVEVPYASLPGFGKSTGVSLAFISCRGLALMHRFSLVPGHKSSLAFGLIGLGEGTPVVAMLGRVG